MDVKQGYLLFSDITGCTEFLVESELLRCTRAIPCQHDNYLPGFAEAHNLPALKASVLTPIPELEFVIPDYAPGFSIFA